MALHALYLRRTRHVFLEPGSGRQPPAVLAALLKDLAGLGFTLSPALIERVQTLSDLAIEGFKARLESRLRKLVGAHVSYTPMYPDFPSQVMEAEEGELYFNAIMHYLGDHLGLRTLPTYRASPRAPLGDVGDLDVIDLGSHGHLRAIGRDLIASTTSLSKTDRQDVGALLKEYAGDLQELLPARIEFKETLAFVAGVLLQQEGPEQALAAQLAPSFATATDILRLAAAMSRGDVSLANPCKFRSFTRRERRFLLRLLGTLKDPREDMRRFAGRWVRLGERLHPGEYRAKFPRAHAAFQFVREDRALETFNSQVESLIARGVSGEHRQALTTLLATRPGEFARRLDDLLRDADAPESVLDAFSGVVDRISVRVLVQLWTHLRHRNEPRSLRVFFPKGNVGRAYGIPDTRVPVPEPIRQRAFECCEGALRTHFAGREPLGSVWIDPALRNFTVPMAQRSASRSLRALSRGTRLALPADGGDTLRLFLWWKEGTVAGTATGRVDIDLSAALYDEQWSWLEHISYTSLRSKKYRAVHSGDITSAPDGACEFIDLDLPSVVKHGARYVVFTVFSFTRQHFAALPECFAGWTMRKEPKSGEIFEPSTVVDKVDLAADSTIGIPLIVDAVKREALWCDLTLNRRPHFGVAVRSMGIDFRPGNNVENNLRGLSLMGRAMTDWVAPTLYDLFTLHATARGTPATDAASADTVFGIDQGITPFHRERITAEFL